jgi:hypothetical protein
VLLLFSRSLGKNKGGPLFRRCPKSHRFVYYLILLRFHFVKTPSGLENIYFANILSQDADGFNNMHKRYFQDSALVSKPFYIGFPPPII